MAASQAGSCRSTVDLWPSTKAVIGAVRIGYTCGYAPTASPQDAAALRANVPAAVKAWMHARLLTLFDKRDQLVMGQVVQVPRDFVDGLLDGLQVSNNFA
jgi:hypothetical protein